jgi:hypothetical protein
MSQSQYTHKFLKINNQVVYALSEHKGVVVSSNYDLENEVVRRVYGGGVISEAILEEISVEIGAPLEYVDFTAQEVEQVADSFSGIDLDDYSSS